MYNIYILLITVKKHRSGDIGDSRFDFICQFIVSLK